MVDWSESLLSIRAIDAYPVFGPVEPPHKRQHGPQQSRGSAQRQEEESRKLVAVKAIMDDSPHACRNQQTDPDVVHPGAHHHPSAMSAPRHGVPYGTGEETEDGRGGEDKRGYVFR
jgi:hypothetical protein